MEKQPLSNENYFYKCIWDNNVEELNTLLRAHPGLANCCAGCGNFSPLLVAAMNGRLDCMRILIRYGAELHHKDKAGRTALHWAASHGYLEVVKYLVNEYSMDPTERSKKGYTPLQLSRRSGKSKVYNYLAAVIAA